MVSIITVNYNSTSHTLDLLKSIEALKREDLEVIVVDNGSTINHEELILSHYPFVKFIRSDVNHGFAGGNNLGILQASGDYLFFVNNDTEFTNDIIGPLVDVLKNNPSIGVVCPLLLYYDAPHDIQYAGFTPVNKYTGRNECLTEIKKGEKKDFYYTNYAHGAAMMLPRTVVNKIGLMPENYFLYYEEYDWSMRVKEVGYKIAVYTKSTFYHKESQSTGKISELKSYFMSRNRILFMRRNSRWMSLAFFWLYYLTVATPGKIGKYIVKGEWGNIRAHLAGIQWNIQFPVFSDIIGYKFNYLRK